MMKQFLRIFCMGFMLICGTLSAQDSTALKNDRKTLQFDHAAIEKPTVFDTAELEQYRHQTDFDYSREDVQINWWQAIKEWFVHIWWSFWESIFGSITPGGWPSVFIQVVKYVLIIGFIGLLVWLFIKLNPGQMLLKPQESPDVLLTDEEKIMKSKALPKMIAEARENKNYRLAIRYCYLLLLKQLTDKNLIHYQFQKTNQAYLLELKSTELFHHFEHLTQVYDFIWYGDFVPTENQYQTVADEFGQIQNLLKKHADA